MSATIVKVGDLLYAVGPGNHAPQGPTDLCVYSTRVKNVRLSVTATPEDYARATYAIDLHDDRPVLGFPQWTYRDHDVGVKIHLSAADALRAFAARAQQHHTGAERSIARARHEIEWAASQAHALGIHTLDKGHDLDMPSGLNEDGQRAHKIIVEYLTKHDLTRTEGCKTFYTPLEWERSFYTPLAWKRTLAGRAAHLIVVYNNNAVGRAFSPNARHDFADEGLQVALRAVGLYFEQYTRGYSTVINAVFSAVFSLEIAL